MTTTSVSTVPKGTLLGINFGIALAHVGNYIYFPILVSTLGVSYSGFWAGFVMFLTYVGRLSATFCYEGLANRLGNRNSVVLGVLVEAVPLGLMGFAHGVAAYSVLAFFVGFGSGISFPGLKNILSAFPEEQRPKAFSSFQMSCQVGALAGALIGGLFVGVDLRILFSVVFALFLAYCVAAYAVIPARLANAADAADASDKAAATRAPLINLGILKGLQLGGGSQYFILSSVFWLLSISFLVGMPLHMAEYVSQWPTSVPFWITGVTLIVLQYPAFRFMIKHFQPGQVMGTAFTVMAVAYVLFGAGRTAAWVVVGCFIVVLGDILFTPSFDLWVSKRIPSDRLAKAMGAMHFFRSFGNMLGTLLAGLFYDLAKTFSVPGLNWYIVAVVAVACAVFSFSSSRREVLATATA